MPYYGGKRRWAPVIWKYLGKPTVYVEPFLGSGAVLLASPHGAADREVVCDTDGHICNFFRALQFDSDACAYWADYPTIHQDLTARHRWLIQWRRDNAERLSLDPEFFDVKAAGWWVWGISSWIGGQWCVDRDRPRERRPYTQTVGGRGVQTQREGLPNVVDGIPRMSNKPGGRGMQKQRKELPKVTDKVPKFAGFVGGGSSIQKERQNLPKVEEKRPLVAIGGGRGIQMQRERLPKVHDQVPAHPASSQGVQAQRKRLPEVSDAIPSLGTGQGPGGGRGVQAQVRRRRFADVPAASYDGARDTRPDLIAWFRALAERFERVVVLNRDWKSAVTPTILMHTPSGPKPPVAVFLDPPYTLDQRHDTIYHSDLEGTSDSAAAESWAWALEHGDVYRIAYCAHEGDIEVPDGWASETDTFRGPNKAITRAKRELIVFSPACLRSPAQGQLI